MNWIVEVTDEFKMWWSDLQKVQQDDVASTVGLLEEYGPHLSFPYSSGINESRHGQMRELRIQSTGMPIRIFYAFDPRRTAILLIGADKTGKKRFYDKYIPIADKLYDTYLNEIGKEGLIK